MEFRVIWEIEIDADSPEQAVQEARAVQLKQDTPATVFGVWDYGEQRMHRVDLAPPTGGLDRAGLVSMRAAFRSLQCAPELQSSIKEIVSVMLIFLDRDEVYSRVHWWKKSGLRYRPEADFHGESAAAQPGNGDSSAGGLHLSRKVERGIISQG
jgi:hypothetical protein